MKLSEILKDWPEKEELNLVSPSDYDMSQLADDTHKYIRDLEILTEKQDTALTSCDREIDREALADLLWTITGGPASELSHGTCDAIAHHIISNMPTWLKPTERK
jgi:hypothetical protein